MPVPSTLTMLFRSACCGSQPRTFLVRVASIARTTWLDFCGNRESGHFATNVNDLFNVVAVAIAEIERTVDTRSSKTRIPGNFIVSA